nr:30S ribosomal protein S20 [Arthrobacter roseus]
MERITLTDQSAIQRESPYVANIKSQKKRNLTNEKARQRNNAFKSELKSVIRTVNTAVASSDKEAAVTALATASRKLDKAVSKGVIHQNNAANRKSAISKKVNAL